MKKLSRWSSCRNSSGVNEMERTHDQMGDTKCVLHITCMEYKFMYGYTLHSRAQFIGFRCLTYIQVIHLILSTSLPSSRYTRNTFTLALLDSVYISM